jgi:hypothetical protein
MPVHPKTKTRHYAGFFHIVAQDYLAQLQV